MHRALVFLFVAVLFVFPSVHASDQKTEAWVSTWGAAQWVVPPELMAKDRKTQAINNRTLRQSLRVGLGGDKLRFRLSNEAGEKLLLIKDAAVSLSSEDGKLKAGSIRKITFNGRATAEIPPGGFFLSDPVDLSVAPLGILTISLFVDHGEAIALNVEPSDSLKRFVSPEGNFVEKTTMPVKENLAAYAVITGVDVRRKDRMGAIVAIGDSITFGARGTEGGWPTVLAKRLHGANIPLSVINTGIGGNQVLRSGWGESLIARFERDALALPGVRYVILSEGLNDIGLSGYKFGEEDRFDTTEARTPEELIQGYRQLITRAHEAGLKIIGGTMTPFSEGESPYYTPEKEKVRLAVNRWIRESGAFDGVIDFDAAVRRTTDALKMRPEFKSDDNLHPNDTGYKAMAEAIDLSLFRN